MEVNPPYIVPSLILKEIEKEVDRRCDCMTILKREQEWTFPAQLGQLTTKQGRKGLLLSHLWCPDDLPRLLD